MVSAQNFEQNDDPESYYVGPDRNDIKLEGVNCTIEQFLCWFLETEEGENFCRITNGMTDIGGSGLELKIGTILSVSFDEWFPRYLDFKVRIVKCEINKSYELMRKKYNIDKVVSRK